MKPTAYRALRVAFASLICLPSGALSAAAQMQAENEYVRCEVSCSTTKKRASFARIAWINLGQSQAPEKFRDAGPAQASVTVEVTCFANGFEEQQFVTLDVAATGAAFKNAAAQVEPIPGLDLKVGQPSSNEPTKSEPASQERPNAARRMQESSVEVEGLTAGLNYRWRVRYRGPAGEYLSKAVVCRAPVCTADMFRKER